MTTIGLTLRTPTGAMVWELWARHKRLFMIQGIVLALGVILVQWVDNFSLNGREIFIPCAYQAGIFALLQTLTCFCYMEIDTRRQQGGLPGYLLLKPVSTIRLVAVPMIAGAVAVMVVFLAWVGLIWLRIGFPAGQILWVCAVLSSFTWSIQAVAWSFANWPWAAQAVLMLLAAGTNIFIGLTPVMPFQPMPAWRIGIVAVLLVGSFRLAWWGVQRVRQGAWESVGKKESEARLRVARKIKPFKSAYHAQFWLDWRRQGKGLPFLTVLGQIAILLIYFLGQMALRKVSATDVEPDPSDLMNTLNNLLLTPFVCSLWIGGMMANFDSAHPGNDIPIYQAVRPLTNGGFVLIKLAVAAVTSALTWLITAGMVLIWLLGCGDTALLNGLFEKLQTKPVDCFLLFLIAYQALVLFTWRNLVGGLWLGMCGRPKVITYYNFIRLPLYLAIIILCIRAQDHPEWRAAWLDWAPTILSAILVLKLALAGAAFNWSLRHKAITLGIMNWIVWGWVGAGLFMTWGFHYVGAALQTPISWVWLALMCFFLMPLAQLALAPVTIAWNRHR